MSSGPPEKKQEADYSKEVDELVPKARETAKVCRLTRPSKDLWLILTTSHTEQPDAGP
jgi:hypothetical protein